MTDSSTPDATMMRVIEVQDEYLAQSEDYARGLASRGQKWTKALVHREEGLTVTNGEGVSYHFKRPRCGYDWSDTRTAAKIIGMLGIVPEALAMTRLQSPGAYQLFFTASAV